MDKEILKIKSGFSGVFTVLLVVSILLAVDYLEDSKFHSFNVYVKFLVFVFLIVYLLEWNSVGQVIIYRDKIQFRYLYRPVFVNKDFVYCYHEIDKMIVHKSRGKTDRSHIRIVKSDKTIIHQFGMPEKVYQKMLEVFDSLQVAYQII